ncbi:MAG TPA: CehA/McbA family metallohydrolase [Planctomycetota bacterium]|nr:CehA/McbA family metallohydrolase [Planctomycetota bacterium]
MKISDPYQAVPGGVWLRGNLHTHSRASDGYAPPQEIVAAYAALHYDFLALSDHDVAPAYAGLDPHGLVLVPASEVSAGGQHVLAVGCSARIEPEPERQKVIGAIASAGGLAVLCHPNWGRDFNHCPMEELARLTGYAGIEVFNGSIIEDPGSPVASDKWDRLLSAGRRVWGLATDDIHFPIQRGRGWCAVRAAARTSEAVLAALRAGNFYASSGVAIAEIGLRGSELRVVAPDAESIAVIGKHGSRLAWAEAPELAWDAAECQSPYFRVECLGRAGTMAWSQPFFVGN